MPVGRGDPLNNDPTYDYSPPVLDRVRYWGDGYKPKNDILLLGVTSSKRSSSSYYKSAADTIQSKQQHHHHHNHQSMRRNYYPQVCKYRIGDYGILLKYILFRLKQC